MYKKLKFLQKVNRRGELIVKNQQEGNKKSRITKLRCDLLLTNYNPMNIILKLVSFLLSDQL